MTREQPMISVAGIRGIVGRSVRPVEFLRYTMAFATLLGRGPIVVGSDTRLSRGMMRHLVFTGLTACGRDVIDIGLAPTPTHGLTAVRLGAAGAIALTASHNPAEWNALKFFNAAGSFLDAEENRRLLEIAASEEFALADYLHLGKVTPREDAIRAHVERVCACVDVDAIRGAGLRVAADCVNGVGGLILEPLFERLGVTAEFQFTDVNAPFPRNPEPLPENLTELGELVRRTGAAVGFATDPDADRLALVDETGRPIGEERTLLLAAARVLEKEKGPMVANLSTTRALDDLAAEAGVELARTPIGEAHVVGRMRSSGALIGGEGNGGVIYPRVHGGRDAATGVALVLEALAVHGTTLSALNGAWPDYAMVKSKYDLAPGTDKAAELGRLRGVFPDAASVNEEDGLKFVYPDRWVHVRPSGTEPVMRIFAEAPTAAAARELVDRASRK